MGQLFRLASAALIGIVLAGCTGTPTPTGTISGLAATGAALGNADISAKCASGSASGSTSADGTYVLTLSTGQITPCLLQVKKGTTVLHSFAQTVGYANVTPVTDLIVTKALGSDAAAAFTGFNATTAAAINGGLVAAKAYVKTEITSITGGSQSGDPITAVFKVGDADDKVLDVLKERLANARRDINDLRQGAVRGVSGALSADLGLDRGALIDPAAVIYTYTAAAIDAGPLKQLTGAAKCDVKVVPLNYKTIGVNGENTNASGVLMLPSGANCTAAAGLVAYAKGTDVTKLRTLANPADGETFLLAAFYAAQGYAVVATDYLGFAKSTYPYHPYLHADSEASSVIDSIRAARRAATNLGSSLSGKVMLTGYSQGGHSSMAAHRAIERENAAEINVVAGAHLAGPYNMLGSLKSEAVIAGYQFFVPYLVTAWQKVYNGSVYSNVTDVFKSPYAGYIENLLPSAEFNYTTLITSGKLPYAPTPTEARDAMFKVEYIIASRQNENSGLMVAGKKNDLLGWNPKSKVLLCGGSGDPTVPPALHQAPMKADFDSRNLTNVTSVDVDAYVRAAYGTPQSNPDFYSNYHGTYEPPFCHAQGKALFDVASAK
jgi:pimeloyl-ACP methyl ester carboxylesterase